MIKRGTVVYVYDNDLAVLKPNGLFIPPTDLAKVWIRQSFNNPHYSSDRRGQYDKYVNHTGVDLAPDFNQQSNLEISAIAEGKIVFTQKNGAGDDHGFGNAIIIEHNFVSANSEQDGKIYSLYAHLDSFVKDFVVGEIIQKGEILGIMGAS